jgi:GNAT superfamily N-acetyltransferase
MNGDPTRIRIIHAREESLADINGLIARSKAHWSWPEGYLDKALPLHRISPAYVRRNHCFEVLDARDRLIAFFAVVVSHTRVLLDNLWVTPDLIGNGIGRRACEHVFRLAREQGWTQLWVLPDPPAEGFYLKTGFFDTGERVSSRVPGGPLFLVYRIQL